VISFDVEGTLITHKFSQYVWEEAIPRLYSNKTDLDFNEAKVFVKQEYSKIGENRIEWYDIKYWFNFFGLSNYEELLEKYKHEIFYYPEVKQVLDELHKNKLLIINSNSAREFLDFELEPIRKFFHRIFSSPFDFKQTKKTSKVYLKVCKMLGVEPKDMFHIGDLWEDDFISPRKIGIKAFFLDRKGKKKGKFFVKNLLEFKTKIEKID
jgi:putative hydrolase of the HAD superfamily